MKTELLDVVRRYADAQADSAGIAPTPVPGVIVMRATAPSGLDYAISSPLVALVLQGRKTVSLGVQRVAMQAGDSLLISADIPTVSQITQASEAAPYYSFVLHLDASVVAELISEIDRDETVPSIALASTPTRDEMVGTALRLMRLLDRPDALAILAAQILRELHYWLLSGPHGAAIRRLGQTDSHAARIGQAVGLLRSGFARPIRVEQLASHAGMSVSSFHEHFRAVTSLSPIQFQKQLRLIEARRLMLSRGLTASSAAYAVGYESVPQFTREYGRLFGKPPATDIEAMRRGTAEVGAL